MDEARLPRRFLTSWVHAKRRTGRPYKSTIHRIQDTIRLTGAHLKNWVELAQDRGSWKDVVHGLAIEIGADGAEERCSSASATALPTGRSMSVTHMGALQHGMHTACQHTRGSCLCEADGSAQTVKFCENLY